MNWVQRCFRIEVLDYFTQAILKTGRTRGNPFGEKEGGEGDGEIVVWERAPPIKWEQKLNQG